MTTARPDEPPGDRDAAAGRFGLPSQLTRFVNRERELAELQRLLPTVRLLSLLGPVGTGKTRLALQLADTVRRRYRDGVALVELAPLGSGALVPGAVLTAFGLEDTAGDAIAALERGLAERRAVLVVDNCEHLVADVAALIDRLLRACPPLTVVATSRELLGVPGEVLWRVPPLAVPRPDRPYTPEELARVDSVALFVDRARQTGPDFELREDNAAALAELLRRLEGLPLAIELAAGWIPVLKPDELLDRIGDRFELLVARDRTLGGRHDSLVAAIDASYQALSEPQQRLFRHLGPFAGGFSLDAMAAVADVDATEAIELLRGLVDRSMVSVLPHASGPTRYRLLEALREFAMARLREADEDAAARERFAAHFVALAERAGGAITRADGAASLRVLDAEVDNLRALFDLDVAGAPALRLRLAAALVPYWHFRGLLSEARLRLRQGTAGARPDAPCLGTALIGLSRMAWAQGAVGEAARCARRAFALARRAGDRAGSAWALLRLSQASFDSGLTGRADAWASHALAIGVALTDHRLQAAAAMQLGQVALVEGRLDDAGRLIGASIDGFRLTGDADQEAIAWLVRGRLYLRQDQPEAAQSALTRCLLALRDLELPRHSVPILESLAAVAAARGDPLRAARLAGAAAGLLDRIGARPPANAPMRSSMEARWRTALAARGADRAFEEGRAMELAQATAYALGEGAAARRRATRARRAVHSPLTRRQLEVARLVAAGLTNKEIATRLFITERTAEGHVEKIRNKLGFSSRVQIAAWLVQTAPG